MGGREAAPGHHRTGQDRTGTDAVSELQRRGSDSAGVRPARFALSRLSDRCLNPSRYTGWNEQVRRPDRPEGARACRMLARVDYY